MKVIVWKSPRLLRPILKKLFGNRHPRKKRK